MTPSHIDTKSGFILQQVVLVTVSVWCLDGFDSTHGSHRTAASDRQRRRTPPPSFTGRKLRRLGIGIKVPVWRCFQPQICDAEKHCVNQPRHLAVNSSDKKTATNYQRTPVAAPAFCVGRLKEGQAIFRGGGQVYMVANNAFPQYGTHTPLFQVSLPFPWSFFSLCFLWFLSFPPVFHSHLPPLPLLWYS